MLTKSDLQSWRQCPRKLWLEHHGPEVAAADERTTYRRATDGNVVGEKARELLGSQVLWPAVQETRELAAEAASQLLTDVRDRPAVEVPMVREGLYIRADALLPEAGGWVLRETKASTFPLKKDKVTTDAPEDHHLDDVAIQIWVMDAGRLNLSRAELNLLDNQWRYPGGGDYSGLFRQLDVTMEVQSRKALVPLWLQGARATLAGDMPLAMTGKQCGDPYPCPFQDFCQKLDPPGPDHPIELLPDAAGKGLATKLRECKGYVSILEPQPEELTGKNAALYRRIQDAHRLSQPILAPECAAVIRQLPYPRFYFDFEGIDLPVPRWEGVRPYEQIPFQWSCHIERAPGAFEHEEFLDLTGQDPSLACIQRMREVIDPDGDGPILVYYATYERGRLQELAQRHPEHTALMQKYIDRLVDLHPLVKDTFYHPDMRGSFSIKKVLPVIAPDLDYAALGEVQEGTGAQVAYLYAALDSDISQERKADLERKLITYCRQDTWAMVEVAYFLAQVGRPTRPRAG